MAQSKQGMKRAKPDIDAQWKKRRIARSTYTGTNPSELIAQTVDDTDQLYAYNITSIKVDLSKLLPLLNGLG